MEENLPPGFRFHPTDEELISYYLRSKVSDPTAFTSKAIAVVDFNKSEPWDLPGKASMGDDEKEWYFFSVRERKYPTGMRTNRATESGYWKTTGKDKDVFSAATAILVGMKKTLVFYKGRAPTGQKTNWVMHEYRLHNNHVFTSTCKEEWVVCRVFQKSTRAAARAAEETTMTSSSQLSVDQYYSANHGDTDTASMVNNEFGDVELPNFSMNMNMNWTSDEQGVWPMLNPNLYVKSLQLLKALHLNRSQHANYHHLIASSYAPQLQQQDQPLFNMDSSLWS